MRGMLNGTAPSKARRSDSTTPKIAMPARSWNSMNMAVALGSPKETSHGAVEGGIACS